MSRISGTLAGLLTLVLAAPRGDLAYEPLIAIVKRAGMEDLRELSAASYAPNFIQVAAAIRITSEEGDAGVDLANLSEINGIFKSRYMKMPGNTSTASLRYLASFAAETYMKRIDRNAFPKLKKIADDPSDITPTISMGITIDHAVAMTLPILSGYIWEAYGFRWVFILAAAFAFAGFFVCLRISTPERP